MVGIIIGNFIDKTSKEATLKEATEVIIEKGDIIIAVVNQDDHQDQDVLVEERDYYRCYKCIQFGNYAKELSSF